MVDGNQEVSETMSSIDGSMTMIDDLNVLKDILEHAPINIMMADAEENVVFVNKKARDILMQCYQILYETHIQYTGCCIIYIICSFLS